MTSRPEPRTPLNLDSNRVLARLVLNIRANDAPPLVLSHFRPLEHDQRGRKGSESSKIRY